MKFLHLVLALLLAGICIPAPAETPVAAYGVTVVGNPASCGVAPVAGLRCSHLASHPYILLGGYAQAGDGGGGNGRRGD
jgi:hypothetical protein